MANPEHFEILKQGVEVWKKWRIEYPLDTPELDDAMMGVYIIDNHVYAHFYPFAASGATSPVLELDQGDKNAEFFMNHFRSIFEDKYSQSLSTKIEYKKENPCEAIKP
jgi:hypothetical protein